MKKAAPFEELSYLAQVQRLRSIALGSLEFYGIRSKKLKLINHGENTTFKLTDRSHKNYLLRVHRKNYHTREGILEELHWLNRLSKTAFLTLPQVVKSLEGESLVEAQALNHPDRRFVSLFQWIDARPIRKKDLYPDLIFEVGRAIGILQKKSQSISVRHRRYWDAEGLVGIRAKFGSIESLTELTPEHLKILKRWRKILYKKLKHFESTYPKRMGLIHADVHFGNVLRFSSCKVAIIDFDDCGYGFHLYDLAVTLRGMEYWFKKTGRNSNRRLQKCKDALLRGYQTQMPFSKKDLQWVETLILARRLMMLAWIKSREDNPKLKRLFRARAQELLRDLAKQ